MGREDGGHGERHKGGENGAGWRGSEKERRPARTILINPVPGSRSRSNRVHDLQGIYIRSSTRGYNSIPSFYSALSAGLKQPARHGPFLSLSLSLSSSFFIHVHVLCILLYVYGFVRWTRRRGAHNLCAPAVASPRTLISASIEDSKLSTLLASIQRAHIVLLPCTV